MKNNFVRAFVVLLAVTGFGASTIAKAHPKTTIVAMIGAPIPTCAPSDPSHCGMQ